MAARPPMRRPARRKDDDGEEEEQDAFASDSEGSSTSSDDGRRGKGAKGIRGSLHRENNHGRKGEKGRIRVPVNGNEGEDEEEQTKGGEVTKNEDDEEVKVPRDTRYFLHDNRGAKDEGDDGGKEGTSDDEHAKGTGKGRKHASDSDGPWLHDKYFELVEELQLQRVSLSEWKSGRQQLWNQDANWSGPNEWGVEWSDASRGWSGPQIQATKGGSRWEGGKGWWDSNVGVDSWSSGDSWEAGKGWGRPWDGQWHSKSAPGILKGGPKGNPKGGPKGSSNWDGLEAVSEDDAGTLPSAARPVKRYTQMTF